MSYIEALFIVLLTAIASAIAALFVRGALDLDVRRQRHEVGSPIYLQIGVVFAVLLAFVFNEVWGEYNRRSPNWAAHQPAARLARRREPARPTQCS